MLRSLKSKVRKACTLEVSTIKFKLYYFIYYFGASSLPLYLPVFFRSVGMDAAYTGILTALRPYMRIVSGPLIGAVADKTGRHKLALMICLFVLALSFTSLCYIPIVQGFDNTRHDQLGNGSNITITPITQVTANLAKQGQYTATISHLSMDAQNTGLTSLQSSSNSSSGYHSMALPKSTIFISSLFQVMIGDFCIAPTDAIVSASIVNEAGSDSYGRQRLFGAIGFGLGSFLTGFAMDQTAGVRYIAGSTPPQGPNFLTAFVIYLGTNMILLILVGFKFEIIAHENIKPPNVFRHVLGLLRNIGAILFIVFIFIIGLVGGVITFFLFWFLQDIGASQTLLGLSYAVMCVAEVVVFPFTGAMIDRLGHVGVLILALLCLIVRLIIYSVLQNPWYVLLVEPMHGITFAAMWGTCVSMASLMAPPELQTTMQGLVSGVHFGLGWGTGALLGGFVYQAYGPRNMFRVSAAFCSVGLILLAAMWKTSIVGSRVMGSKDTDVSVGEYEMIPGESDEVQETR